MGTAFGVYSLADAVGQMHAMNGSRPRVNKRLEKKYGKQAPVHIVTNRGLTVNSVLRKDEWEELDRAVVPAAVAPLRLTNILRTRGLTRRIGSLGTLLAQYNRVSEMTPANISLRGHASGEKDLVDFDLKSVPVPIVFKEFELDMRVLLSGRMMGNGIDVANAEAAARVVGEKIEDLAINGDTSISLNSNTIYGLVNHPDRNTDTATNYGGGDWGTIANVTKTVAGMIAAAQADGYYGPYGIFVATTQYNQATLAVYDDGTAQSARQRILNTMPEVAFFEHIPQLTDGTVILVQLTSDVIQWAYVEGYFPLVNLEWLSGDGMQAMFKAMSVGVPIIKSAYGGKSGVVHATGA